MIGLRRALLHELLWGTLCAGLLGAILWVAAPVLNMAAALPSRGRVLAAVAGAVVSAPIIWILWRVVQEKAGFNGAILGAIAWFTISGVAVAGASLACWRGPLTASAALLVAVGIMFTGLIAVIYDVLTD